MMTPASLMKREAQTVARQMPHQVPFMVITQMQRNQAIVCKNHLRLEPFDVTTHHRVQSNQLLVLKLFHDVSFRKESFWRHGSGLQSLDRDLDVLVPHTCDRVNIASHHGFHCLSLYQQRYFISD